MIREAPAMTVRQNLGELLNEVQYRGDSVVITKGGKPVAAIVDIALYENIRRMKDDFDRLCAELAAAGERVSDDEAESLIGEAAAEARKLTRKTRASTRSAREAGEPPAR
jgi:prevent-host-death family protein